MGSEHSLWLVTRDKLRQFGVLHRVENRLEEGTPDVAYSLRFPPGPSGRVGTGWLELKYAPAWPVNLDVPLILPHNLTDDQCIWAEGWCAAGGQYGLLVQVGRDYFLFGAERLRAVQVGMTLAEYVRTASASGTGSFPRLEILKNLCGWT